LAYARLFAKTNELRIAKQHGLNLPPFNVLNKFRLIQKYAKKVVRKTFWINNALFSDSINISHSGIPPFLMLRDKFKVKIKAITNVGKMSAVLNAINPNVESITHFISEPSVFAKRQNSNAKKLLTPKSVFSKSYTAVLTSTTENESPKFIRALGKPFRLMCSFKFFSSINKAAFNGFLHSSQNQHKRAAF
jgi:hypothetical protein